METKNNLQGAKERRQRTARAVPAKQTCPCCVNKCYDHCTAKLKCGERRCVAHSVGKENCVLTVKRLGSQHQGGILHMTCCVGSLFLHVLFNFASVNEEFVFLPLVKSKTMSGEESCTRLDKCSLNLGASNL